MPSRSETALAFLVALVLTVALQWRGNAYTAELHQFPDESAHLVSGLMVREYLSTWPPQAPLPFARDYYAHYSRVSIGHYPPFFYLVEGLWLLALPALLLQGVLYAANATLIYWLVRRYQPWWTAGAVGGAFLLLPVVQWLAGMVMLEGLLTLLVVAAMASWMRYLETGRGLAVFSLLCLAAVMTKPSGWALGLCVLFSVVLAGRFDVLRRREVYLAALSALLVGVPWHYATLALQAQGWSTGRSAKFLLGSVFSYNTRALWEMAGWPVAVLAVWAIRRGRPVLAGWVLGVFVFVTFVAPVREARHLLPVAAAMLVAVGMYTRWAVLAPAVVLLFCTQWPGKTPQGFRELVPRIRAAAEPCRILLSTGEAWHEGWMLAEFARAEPKPVCTVLRASKGDNLAILDPAIIVTDRGSPLVGRIDGKLLFEQGNWSVWTRR